MMDLKIFLYDTYTGLNALKQKNVKYRQRRIWEMYLNSHFFYTYTDDFENVFALTINCKNLPVRESLCFFEIQKRLQFT